MAAGISAIQLEDQEFPKKCSHSMQVNCVPTQQMGFQIAIWPSFLPLAAIHTIENALSAFKETGSSETAEIPLASFAEFSDLIGFDRVREFSRHWDEI
jgi:2-methylisocitrate lyase-like PEP mutase family enzyme